MVLPKGAGGIIMGSPSNILIAEDQETDVYLMKWAFRKAGFEHGFVHVSDGQLTIDYLKGYGPYCDRRSNPFPNLLLLDLKMPRLSGFDVLIWLHNNPLSDKFPIVVLTSSDIASDRERALSLGAADYKVKPCELDDMVELARELDEQWLKRAKAAA